MYTTSTAQQYGPPAAAFVLALGEPLVCEDVAVRAIRAGSLVEFSPDEVERHLQRAVEELRIMRSRGNVYFV